METHKHYWRIDRDGYGVCRICKVERQFSNEEEDVATSPFRAIGNPLRRRLFPYDWHQNQYDDIAKIYENTR